MHYHVEVWVENTDNIAEQIEKILEPYNEEKHENGWWDWYSIGGRWTGAKSNYDPASDPANYKPCSICGGSGFRNDFLGRDARREDPTYTCNSCGYHDESGWHHGKMGAGLELKFAPDWKPRNEDVVPVGEISDTLTCATLVIDGTVLRDEIWDGSNWTKTGFDGNVKNALARLGITHGYLVTVDCHD